jgi:hypothetical protein
MSAKTDYYENLLLNAFLRNDAAARAELNAANLRMALFTTLLGEGISDPAAATEVAVAGYSRIAYATIVSAFPAPVAGVTTNTGLLSWTLTGAVPASIKAWGIIDDTPATDRIWWYHNLGTPITPGAGSTVFYSSGQLTVQES